MAIYNPPKGNNWGSILQTAGTTTMSAGGAITATTGITGIGAVAGIATAAVGGIMSGIGSLINGGQQRKQQQYDINYQKRVAGENALNKSIESIKGLSGNNF